MLFYNAMFTLTYSAVVTFLVPALGLAIAIGTNNLPRMVKAR